jgi:hypothetical protein
MDRDLAEKIHKYLLDADQALRRAEWAGDAITEGDERRAFIELVHDVGASLHFDLLQMLYREHPDLEPDGDEEEPHIDSTLRWEEVSLPPGITEAEIDAMIFSLLKPRRQKMAKIVGNAGMRFHDESKPFSFEIIAARIIALEQAGRIESYGDLRYWRFSEIRLP